MKNVIKRFCSVTLIVLVTLISATAANNSLAMKIIGKRIFQISVENVVGQAQIKIVDRVGTILYMAQVSHDGAYTRKFDVSSLPVGVYLLEIEDEFKTKTVELNISKEVSINLEQARTRLNPVITVLANKVTVSMHALEKEKMTISFFDESSHQIGRYSMKGKNYVAKKFNLELLDAGTYKVLINHRGRTFSKELNIL